MAIEPNYFIIGAARSGTTAVAEMLRQHPDVFVTRPKEPHFLAFENRPPRFTGPGDDQTVNRISVTSIEAYLALFESAAGKSARGDASVSTLYYPEESLATLGRHFPDARLVVILREPAERAFSAFQYLRVRGLEPCSDFVEALGREEQRRAAGWHHMWQYAGMGRYGQQLEPFVRELGADRVKIVFYEDLSRDSAAVAREIFEFLGVDHDVAVVSERINVSGVPRSTVAQTAIQWATTQPRIRAAIKAGTPFMLRERVRRVNLEHADVPDDARVALRDGLAGDVAELRDLLSRSYPDLLAKAPTWLTAARREAVTA